MMKCEVFEVKNTTNWPIFECGGAMASAGDIIFMRPEQAGRFFKANEKYLTKMEDKEATHLRGVYYQIFKKKNTDKEKKSAVSSPNEVIEEKAVDKSMQNKARRKAKSRRKE